MMAGNIVMPVTRNRPTYQSTIPIPWRIMDGPDAPAFGGDKWWNDCGRKRAFFAVNVAQMEAWLLADRARKSGMVLRAYRCNWCEWWHVGHRPAAKGER